MPWCPKCRQEFQNERTVCPDCSEPLVEEQEVELVQTEIEFFAEVEVKKFLAFLEYSNIQDAKCEKDATLDILHILCKEEDVAEVNKLFAAFKSVEEQEVEEEIDPEEEVEEESDVSQEESQKASAPYVKKSVQYQETSSTGIMLVVIGVLGLGYVALNYAGTLHLLNGVIPYCLNLVLFCAAMIYGIVSLYQADKLKGQIEEEETLRKEVLSWLTEQITDEFLEKASDTSLPKEANYLKQYQAIKDLAIKQYPDIIENFIESIVDEVMNEE